MKAPLLFLSIPIAAALAFAPYQNQDPQDPKAQDVAEVVTIMPISEMQYIDLQGKTVVVSARNVVEIRLFDDQKQHVRLEMLYENGDYSMIDAQAMHLLRNGPSKRDVKLVRTQLVGMRFPSLP